MSNRHAMQNNACPRFTRTGDREALQDWLDEVETEEDIDALLGRLWHCTETLPLAYCQQLDLRSGSSYAAAAQKIASERTHPSTKVAIYGRKLTDEQIDRQDFVDDAIHTLMSELAGQELEWDISLVADVRDSVRKKFADLGIMSEIEFYPYIDG